MSRARTFGWTAGLLAIAAIAGAAVVTKGGSIAGLVSGADASAQHARGVADAAGPATDAAPARAAVDGGTGTFIVVFHEPALGAYRGEIAGLPAAQRTVGARGKAKLRLAIAKGKKHEDKRETVKKRDWQREKARLMREKG